MNNFIRYNEFLPAIGRIGISILLMLLGMQSVFAQSPDWMDGDYRRFNYPSNDYLTAFISGEKNQNEELSDAIVRIKELAKEEISASILTTIKSSSELNVLSENNGKSDSYKQSYSSNIKTSTFTKINGVRVDTHVKKGKKRKQLIYAFAHVKKADLINYYQLDIRKKMSEAESLLNTADELVKNLEKHKAEETLLYARKMCKEINFAYEILTALDGNPLNFGIRIEDINKVKAEIEKGLHSIKSGPSFCLQIHSYIFNSKTAILENKLKAELAERKYSFTKLMDKADWLIIITAKARKHNNDYGAYISYVDATISCEKAFNKEEVYQNTIKQKGVSLNNFTEASELAYEDLAKKINAIIIKHCSN